MDGGIDSGTVDALIHREGWDLADKANTMLRFCVRPLLIMALRRPLRAAWKRFTFREPGLRRAGGILSLLSRLVREEHDPGRVCPGTDKRKLHRVRDVLEESLAAA